MIAVFLFMAQMSCPDRQAHAMGFSQETTKHTFRLFSDGGAIEVRAKDDATLKLVREHLRVIAKSFAAGDFSKPQEVHDRLPEGAAKMKELRSEITYRYNDLASGGQVRIKTKSPRALEAIHEFLRFQIREHKTGDSTTTIEP